MLCRRLLETARVIKIDGNERIAYRDKVGVLQLIYHIYNHTPPVRPSMISKRCSIRERYFMKKHINTRLDVLLK